MKMYPVAKGRSKEFVIEITYGNVGKGNIKLSLATDATIRVLEWR